MGPLRLRVRSLRSTMTLWNGSLSSQQPAPRPLPLLTPPLLPPLRPAAPVSCEPRGAFALRARDDRRASLCSLGECTRLIGHTCASPSRFQRGKLSVGPKGEVWAPHKQYSPRSKKKENCPIWRVSILPEDVSSLGRSPAHSTETCPAGPCTLQLIGLPRTPAGGQRPQYCHGPTGPHRACFATRCRG